MQLSVDEDKIIGTEPLHELQVMFMESYRSNHKMQLSNEDIHFY